MNPPLCNKKLISKKFQLSPAIWYIRNERGSTSIAALRLIKNYGPHQMKAMITELKELIKRDKYGTKTRKVIIKFLIKNGSDYK